MKKFQQGGADVFNIPSTKLPEVGNIDPSPLISLPIPAPVNIPAMSNLAASLTQRQRQREQDIRNQQNQLDTAKRQFYALDDALIGPLDNPYQVATVNAIKKEYGIDDDFYKNTNTNDLQEVRMKTDQFYKFAHDARVLDIMGEVEAAHKYMERPLANMTQEEFDTWDAYVKKYEQAVSKDYDVRYLDRSMYKRPAQKVSQRPKMANDIIPTLQKISETVDISDPNEIPRLKRIMADQWAINYGDFAEQEGLITQPPDGSSPVLTPEGERIVEDRVAVYNRDYRVRLEDKSKIQKSHSKSGPEAKGPFDDARKIWEDVLTSDPAIDEKYGGLKLEEHPVIAKYLLSLATGTGEKLESKVISEDVLDDIREKLDDYFKRTSPGPTPAGPAVPTVGVTGKPVVTVSANPAATSAPAKVTWVKDANGKLVPK